MAKEEIVEGLRQAVSRGESLEKAMATFFNAGYPNEDVEEAARALQMPTANQSQSKMRPQPLKQQQKTPSVQRVSDYEKKPSKTGTIITIILFFLLIILLGILAAVILFKEELSNFLNNFF
jgi:hypothetical protein